MRRPTDIERLYLDFDGFFASVEQQVHPRLRGKPVNDVGKTLMRRRKRRGISYRLGRRA
jgi:nucleotidyltransferase/DNA polymerase involved in DNA repair